jgi:hypothetical protein
MRAQPGLSNFAARISFDWLTAGSDRHHGTQRPRSIIAMSRPPVKSAAAFFSHDIGLDRFYIPVTPSLQTFRNHS